MSWLNSSIIARRRTEEAFSKVKVLPSNSAARTRETLIEAMGEALSAITAQTPEGS